MESMRSIGYAFETAIADVIDNSISAGSTQIDILFSPFDEAFVAILDNGEGMSKAGLLKAMQHGARNVGARTPTNDLGRFGLGLKTASLSQCRQLTVITKKDDSISGAEWNLDEIERAQDWSLLVLESTDIKSVPNVSQLKCLEQGTLVVWRAFDRAMAGEADHAKALQDRIDVTRDHLALVFHRFLERTKNRLVICVNGQPIVPVDPFLRNRRGVQLLPQQAFSVDGQTVSVQPFILPHLSRLTAADIENAGGVEGLRKNQGFYVYRNERLITWGTWFRLSRQDEMTKLARVMVDIPETLDHLWSLDIKKSSAFPPDAVRTGLRAIVDRISDKSRKVYTYRGRKATESAITSAWNRIELRDGRYSYQVNREHPFLTALRDQLPDDARLLISRLIEMIEMTIPFDALYADMADEKMKMVAEVPPEKMREMLYELASLIVGSHENEAQRSALLEGLKVMEPFSRYGPLTEEIIGTLA
jgi:hypothetical protein